MGQTVWQQQGFYSILRDGMISEDISRNFILTPLFPIGTLIKKDSCTRILNKCYDQLKIDLRTNVFAAKYSDMFMATMPDEHVKLLSELKSMEESRIHEQDRNVKLLNTFLTAGVHDYLNFKSCLQKYLLELIEETEDQYFEIKSKEEDKNANEAQDDEPLMGENGNNE